MTPVALSSHASRRHRAFAPAVAGARSTGVRVARESAARPGGFGNADRLPADLAEVRVFRQ